MTLLDTHCKTAGSVYDNMSVTLNQTNIATNNNKFYIMQVVDTGKDSEFVLFTRYGRMGEPGKATHKTMAKEAAVRDFMKTFRTKTKNTWGIVPFVSYAGSYFMADVAEVTDVTEKTEDDDSKDPTEVVPEEPLQPEVDRLISLISDRKMMQRALTDLNIDEKKMPIGKMSSNQLDKAKKVLHDILADIDAGGRNVDALSSTFYTYVPCSFGRRKPPAIDTTEDVDKYFDLVEDLRNIQVAASITKKRDIGNREIYDGLNAKISLLDKDSEMYREILKYMSRKGSTHNRRANVVDIFEIERDGEEAKFRKDMKNRTLLIHGSRMANWISIIKNGLVLDPERMGAVISGKMWGFGVYHANLVSKSLGYVDYSGGYGCLLLNEVALGESHCMKQSMYNASKKNIKGDSIHGLGSTTPDGGVTVDGVYIPNGAPVSSGISGCSVLYDEFISFDTSEIRQRYLVLIKQ